MFDNYRPFLVCFGFALLIYLICKLCCKRKIEAQLPVSMDQQAQEQTQAQAHSHEQQRVDEPKGLNQETIDSYPTVVIGENGKLMDQDDDNTCPICLCEYDKNNVLKILPECLHKFHRECLDEWLKVQATCPVCRTQPPRF